MAISRKPKNRKFFGININAENTVLFLFIVCALIIGLLPINYGFIRDELYYIALSKHLAWGYVDVPPLMPLCIAIMRFLFGESVFAMHILPAVFGAIILILTREMVRKIGGNLYAQTFALLCLLMSPVFIFRLSRLSYDSFDCLFWALCLYFLVQLLTSENKKYWLYLGVCAGLGLMSKFGMLWLMFGIIVAMLFTKERKYFISWQLWVGGLIALVIVSPYITWIVHTKFLTFEYFKNYTQDTAPLTITSFFLQQLKAENLLTLPIWIAGLYYFLFNNEGKKFRLFALAYIFIAILCIVQQAKYYMITPIYPVIFAGGAVFVEKFANKIKSIYFIGCVYALLIIIVGLVIMPFVRPIFPINFLIKYLRYTHLYRSGEGMPTEKYQLGILPQQFADCLGWQDMTRQVAEVYYKLPKKERINTAIITRNYGEASGIYFYGKKYNLPMPISQHLQYYVWGTRNATTNGSAILVGYEDFADLQKNACKVIQQVGHTYNKYAVPYENQPIFLCRGFKRPIALLWRAGKAMRM